MKSSLNSWEQSSKAVLENVNSKEVGLSEADAKLRLETNGPNILSQAKKQSHIVKFLKQFADIMILILLVAGIVSIVFKEYVDGAIILAIVVINAIIGFFQEYKAEKSLENLKKLTTSQAKVLRDGEVKKINCSDIVVGDIVILEAGDIVPADIRLIETAMLKCDESSLTGESEPTLKNPDAISKKNCGLADRTNMAYSSSVVVYGRGVGVVVATGMDTEIGKIANILKETEKNATPLQKSLKTVGKMITVIVLIVAVVIFLIEFLKNPNSSLLDAFMTAVAVAVAAIPESLPTVVTIIMAMGVGKLAKRGAIIKKLHAVETLGCCEIICSDKTGTITKNQMTVKKLSYNQKTFDEINIERSKEFEMLQNIFVLCNDSVSSKKKFLGDPTETALCDYAFGLGFNKQKLDEQNPRIFEIPFDSKRKIMSCVCDRNGKTTMYSKGGVDEILNICSHALIDGQVVQLNDNIKQQILEINNQFTNVALRVLAGAYKPCFGFDDHEEENMIYVGLAGMIDPPRDEVEVAVKKCGEAGMRAVMITGDHKSTALSIAKSVGIATKSSEVLTGAQIDMMSDEVFLEKLKKVSVFARVSPENKVRIVEGFKKLGKVVAMTGDGVNDAPSLKKANIGVGMGITGTDVTKEVADMILTDDSFSTIVIAVEEGRKVYTNIQKTVGFLFTTNVCEVLAMLICIIAFPEMTFLLPVQILFINFISDSFPAIALGVEPAEKDIMQTPPRDAKKSLFSGGNGIKIIVMALIQAGLVVCAFIIGKHFGGNMVASSMAFYTLNLIQALYILCARTNSSIFKTNLFQNKWLLGAVGFNILMTLILIFTPLGKILGLVSLSWDRWLIVIGLASLIIVFDEIYKLIRKSIRKK